MNVAACSSLRVVTRIEFFGDHFFHGNLLMTSAAKTITLGFNPDAVIHGAAQAPSAPEIPSRRLHHVPKQNWMSYQDRDALVGPFGKCGTNAVMPQPEVVRLDLPPAGAQIPRHRYAGLAPRLTGRGRMRTRGAAPYCYDVGRFVSQVQQKRPGKGKDLDLLESRPCVERRNLPRPTTSGFSWSTCRRSQDCSPPQ